MPGKPLSALIVNNLSVLVAFGSLRYSGPNTATTTLQMLPAKGGAAALFLLDLDLEGHRQSGLMC